MNGGRITSEEKQTVSTYVGLGILVVLGTLAVYFFFLQQKEVEQTTGFDPNRPIPSDAVLKRRLTAEQYSVVRGGRTEMAFQNDFWDNERTGIYVDVISGEPLFTSLDKYDAGLGMLSFAKPISKDLLAENLDTSHGLQRTQLRAKRSNAQLGHLIPDTNSPTGQRYAVNSAAFRFIPVEQMKEKGYEEFLSLLEKK